MIDETANLLILQCWIGLVSLAASDVAFGGVWTLESYRSPRAMIHSYPGSPKSMHLDRGRAVTEWAQCGSHCNPVSVSFAGAGMKR